MSKQSVQAGVPKRKHFNTRAKSKDVQLIKAFKDTEDGLALSSTAPTEDTYDVNELIAENKQMKEVISEDSYHSLRRYSFIGFQAVNAYLRGDRTHKDYPDADLMNVVNDDIAGIDSAFNEYETASGGDAGSTTKHVIYRQTYAPEGWTAADYVRKYYAVGETIADPSYLSTSHSPSYIVEKVKAEKKRHRQQESVVLKVLTTEGLSMQTELPSNSSVQSREMERLLPRNHRLVVAGHSRQTFVDAGLTEENYAHPHHRGAKSKKLTVVHLVSEDMFKGWQRENK